MVTICSNIICGSFNQLFFVYWSTEYLLKCQLCCVYVIRKKIKISVFCNKYNYVFKT